MSERVDLLSEFTIALPTKAQSELVSKAAYVAFGRGQTFEQFVARENASRAESWHADGAERTWVLVRKDDPEGDVYSCCGTFRRKAYIKQKGSDKIEETWTYGIQSVATPVHHHRNGYARHLLKLLHYILAPPSTLPSFPKAWGTPPTPLSAEIRQTIPYASAAFLWSDVGDFYAKCTVGESLPGYLIDDTKNRALVWKTLPSSSNNDEWEWIYEKDMPAVTEELEEATKATFEGIKSKNEAVIQTNPGNVGTLPFLPLWSLAESTLEPEARAKHPFGLRKKNPDGSDTIVILTPGLKAIYGRLCITLHYNLQPEDVSSLLAKMDELAPAKETKEGQIWGLDPSGEIAKAFQAQSEREVDQHIRQGMRGHLLAVASYLPNGEPVDFLDSQIWNWC